jgi:hypothetical protein
MCHTWRIYEENKKLEERIREPGGKTPLWRDRSRWKYNIKFDLIQIVCENTDGIQIGSRGELFLTR